MKFKIGDKGWGIYPIDDDEWELFQVEIVNYWIKGHNSYYCKVSEKGHYVFWAPLVFKTQEEAEEVLKKLQLQSSIRLAANDEINKIIHGH